uniref:Uncharacterized protein n=1 Tax=Alexandrium monilatum TaxID=311494 RepID=A0A7S4PSK8_9DINO
MGGCTSSQPAVAGSLPEARGASDKTLLTSRAQGQKKSAGAAAAPMPQLREAEMFVPPNEVFVQAPIDEASLEAIDGPLLLKPAVAAHAPDGAEDSMPAASSAAPPPPPTSTERFALVAEADEAAGRAASATVAREVSEALNPRSTPLALPGVAQASEARGTVQPVAAEAQAGCIDRFGALSAEEGWGRDEATASAPAVLVGSCGEQLGAMEAEEEAAAGLGKQQAPGLDKDRSPQIVIEARGAETFCCWRPLVL